MAKFVVSCTTHFIKTYDAENFRGALAAFGYDHLAPKDFDPATFKIEEVIEEPTESSTATDTSSLE